MKYYEKVKYKLAGAAAAIIGISLGLTFFYCLLAALYWLAWRV
jgi:hypothetical protein